MFLHHGSHDVPVWNGSIVTIDWGGKPHPHVVSTIASSLTTGNNEVRSTGYDNNWIFALIFWALMLLLFLIVEYIVVSYHRKHVQEHTAEDIEMVKEEEGTELPDSIYALPLACAFGQVQFFNGTDVPVFLAATVALPSWLCQCATLVMVYDWIQKAATPITAVPDCQWKSSPFSTNATKFLMSFYLSTFSATDSEQFLRILRETLLAVLSNSGRFGSTFRVPSLQAMLIVYPIAHFTSLVMTACVGICVLLSAQSVPLVVTGAVGMCFVTQVDDIMWKFVSLGLGLNADLKVKHRIGEKRGFRPQTESLFRALVWFPVAMMLYLYLDAMMTDRLPWLPNPLVPLGLSG
mmetsp:Transcript_58779/g.102861  ORF Transcript_58779/g.102861 Transcript_58779/m.102861 type:complete len:349 (+) Transcript_58779:43-1089(+)